MRPKRVVLAFAIRRASFGSSVILQNRIWPIAKRLRLGGTASHAISPSNVPIAYCKPLGNKQIKALKIFINLYMDY